MGLFSPQALFALDPPAASELARSFSPRPAPTAAGLLASVCKAQGHLQSIATARAAAAELVACRTRLGPRPWTTGLEAVAQQLASVRSSPWGPLPASPLGDQLREELATLQSIFDCLCLAQAAGAGPHLAALLNLETASLASATVETLLSAGLLHKRSLLQTAAAAAESQQQAARTLQVTQAYYAVTALRLGMAGSALQGYRFPYVLDLGPLQERLEHDSVALQLLGPSASGVREGLAQQLKACRGFAAIQARWLQLAQLALAPGFASHLSTPHLEACVAWLDLTAGWPAAPGCTLAVFLQGLGAGRPLAENLVRFEVHLEAMESAARLAAQRLCEALPRLFLAEEPLLWAAAASDDASSLSARQLIRACTNQLSVAPADPGLVSPVGQVSTAGGDTLLLPMSVQLRGNLAEWTGTLLAAVGQAVVATRRSALQGLRGLAGFGPTDAAGERRLHRRGSSCGTSAAEASDRTRRRQRASLAALPNTRSLLDTAILDVDSSVDLFSPAEPPSVSPTPEATATSTWHSWVSAHTCQACELALRAQWATSVRDALSGPRTARKAAMQRLAQALRDDCETLLASLTAHPSPAAVALTLWLQRVAVLALTLSESLDTLVSNRVWLLASGVWGDKAPSPPCA